MFMHKTIAGSPIFIRQLSSKSYISESNALENYSVRLKTDDNISVMTIDRLQSTSGDKRESSLVH